MDADNASTQISGDDYRRYLAALILFHQAAADRCGLSGTDYHAVNLLELEGPMTSGQLAARLLLSTGATTRLVDRLATVGLVERVSDSGDRRRALVRWTGKLPDGLADTLQTVRPPIAQALASLSERERAGVAAYVRAAAQAYTEAARSLEGRAPTPTRSS